MDIMKRSKQNTRTTIREDLRPTIGTVRIFWTSAFKKNKEKESADYKLWMYALWRPAPHFQGLRRNIARGAYSIHKESAYISVIRQSSSSYVLLLPHSSFESKTSGTKSLTEALLQ